MNKPTQQSKASASKPNVQKPKNGKKQRSVSVPRTLRTGVQQRFAPASVSVSMTSMEPSITRTNKSVRINHRELVLPSVAGSTTFTVQSFLHLNPGLSATFPWLAPQAQQWDMYKCHKLHAVWVPIAASSVQGDIILSPNYDSSDPQPATETQAANNWGSMTNSVWQPFTLILDREAMMGLGPKKYVRPCAVAGDIKTFDVGTLAICSNNETGTSAVGKLYLEYDFEFFTPQNDPSPATTPVYTSAYSNNSSDQTFTTTVAAACLWDTLVFDPLGIGAAASGVFTPPAGCYNVRAYITCSDTSAEQFSVLAQFFKNGASLPISPNIASIAVDSAAGNANLEVYVEAVIPCNGTDTIQLQCVLTGAAGTLKSIHNRNALFFSLA